MQVDTLEKIIDQLREDLNKLGARQAQVVNGCAALKWTFESRTIAAQWDALNTSLRQIKLDIEEDRADALSKPNTCANCPHSDWQHAREGDARLETEEHEIGACYVKGCDCEEFTRDPNDCAECARAHGPHYQGPCEH